MYNFQILESLENSRKFRQSRIMRYFQESNPIPRKILARLQSWCILETISPCASVYLKVLITTSAVGPLISFIFQLFSTSSLLTKVARYGKRKALIFDKSNFQLYYSFFNQWR